MNTGLPVSTISFNTTGFLEERLVDMTNRGLLEWWAFIPHEPEPNPDNDDGNGKKHSHVRVHPAKRVQTEAIRQYLREYDPKRPKDPLGCLPFWSSKHFGEWYLYVLHDVQYLKWKGLTREYHYRPEDIVTSDRDALNWFVRQNDLKEISPIQSMIDAIGMGMRFEEYFYMGKIPVQQIRQYREAWAIVTSQMYKGNVSRETQNDNDVSNASDKFNKGNQQ